MNASCKLASITNRNVWEQRVSACSPIGEQLDRITVLFWRTNCCQAGLYYLRARMLFARSV